jgi:hypothetical protein
MYLRGSVGQEGFVVTVGHVEDAPLRKNKYLRSEGESIKKFPARWTYRRFLTSIFHLPLVDNVSEGIRLSDVVGGWREVVGRRWRSMRWEIKIFREQIKTSPQKQSLPSTSHLIFLSSASRRCIRQAVGVGLGGGWPWFKWQTMPWWRGGATRGESMSCAY